MSVSIRDASNASRGTRVGTVSSAKCVTRAIGSTSCGAATVISTFARTAAVIASENAMVLLWAAHANASTLDVHLQMNFHSLD